MRLWLDGCVVCHMALLQIPLTAELACRYGPRQFPEKLIPKFTLLASRREVLPVHGDGEHNCLFSTALHCSQPDCGTRSVCWALGLACKHGAAMGLHAAGSELMAIARAP